MKLTVVSAEGNVSGYIVETEAYTADDLASHSAKGITARNKSMFKMPGTVYVYVSYGIHYCINIVCGNSDGQAVLIRAMQPVEGIELMQIRRSNSPHVMNGPGRVTQALGITLDHDGTTLGHNIILEEGFTPLTIIETTRIGVTKDADMLRRYYIQGSPYISRP